MQTAEALTQSQTMWFTPSVLTSCVILSKGLNPHVSLCLSYFIGLL